MEDKDRRRRLSDRMPLRDFPVAMAYVPWQEWEDVCEIDEAFQIGTIFPSLNKPFVGCKF